MTEQSVGGGRWHRVWGYVAGMKFRYKIAAYVGGAMLIVGGIVTFLVWETTRQLSEQIKLSTDARAEVARMSQELHHSALTAELMKGMKDEAFIQSLQKRSEEIDAQYEQEMKKAADSQEEQLQRQKQIFRVWVLSYALLTALVVFFSLLLSRRIASPVKDFQRMVEAVSQGKLSAEPRDLRVSGEFKTLEASLVEMILKLRAQKEEMLSEAKTLIMELESATPHKGAERLRRLIKTWEEQLSDDKM